MTDQEFKDLCQQHADAANEWCALVEGKDSDAEDYEDRMVRAYYRMSGLSLRVRVERQKRGTKGLTK